jgi:Flp pilus assembly protein TadD
MPGSHRFSADFSDGTTLDGTVTLGNVPAQVAIAPPVSGPLRQLRARLDAGLVLGPNGAWEFYRSQSFTGSDRTAAATLVTAALEDLGQACVSDYVQSTDTGLKELMLQRAVDAFERLETLRPNDPAMEVRKLFCTGRLQIAQGRFTEAVASLQQSLRRDSQFACAYNALGVALSRLDRGKEARLAFEAAAKLTPEWALPPFQIASQLIASGDLNNAVPYLEQAVAYNPRSVVPRWNLLHVNRLLHRSAAVERQARDLIRLNPNYAPTYLELGLAYETDRNFAKAAEAYDTYVMLAPNYADSKAVRARADGIRLRAKRPPSLIR